MSPSGGVGRLHLQTAAILTLSSTVTESTSLDGVPRTRLNRGGEPCPPPQQTVSRVDTYRVRLGGQGPTEQYRPPGLAPQSSGQIESAVAPHVPPPGLADTSAVGVAWGPLQRPARRPDSGGAARTPEGRLLIEPLTGGRVGQTARQSQAHNTRVGLGHPQHPSTVGPRHLVDGIVQSG